MTVQGETTTVPSVDRAAAEQQFTEIFQAYRVRLVRYLAWLLKMPYHPLAEDLAQESFLLLWRDFVAKDSLREPEKVYGLVKVIARHQLAEHFKAGRNREYVIDFDDPANRPLDGAGQGYGLGMPETALLVAELDRAMERMGAASEKWRNLNKESVRLRLKLADGWKDHLGGLPERTRLSLEQQAEETEHEEETALADFREACLRVGEARADIERAAGPNWRSSAGMPPSHAKGGPRSYSKDTSMTHCSSGHFLDRLNTAFTAEGERRCRACARDKHLRSKPRKTAETAGKGTRRTIDPAVIEQARRLLADPGLGHNFRTVAELLGVGQMTLYRNFPGGVAAIRRDAELAVTR